MNRLSFSRLGLAAKCLYSFRPDVDVPERSSGRPAAIGRIVHALVEARVTGKAMADDVDANLLAEAMAIFEGPLLGFVDSRRWTVCEAGYRYDSRDDRCEDGPRRGEPGYDDVPSYVLHGTVDLVEVDREASTALVVDVKTGKPPSDAEQILGQGVAISRRFGVKTVRVQYARALKTKLDILNDEVLDEDRLDAEAGRIARRLRMLPMAEPNEGEWCQKLWCPAWSVCPAKRDRDDYVPPPAPAEASLYDDTVRLF